MATEQEVRDLKRRHSMRLLRQPGVAGVGVEKDDHGGFILTLHLNSDDPTVRAQLPKELDGHPLRFVVSGPFQKH